MVAFSFILSLKILIACHLIITAEGFRIILSYPPKDGFRSQSKRDTEEKNFQTNTRVLGFCSVSYFDVIFIIAHCLNTIFQKLHFSKSHFSETPQDKYDHVIFLQLMSPKKCHKKFENRFTNKIIMPENHFE